MGLPKDLKNNLERIVGEAILDDTAHPEDAFAVLDPYLPVAES